MEISSQETTLANVKERKARRAWYLYDFGNSAYAAIVLLAVYSAYFKDAVVGGAEGTRLWGISVGIAAILVAIALGLPLLQAKYKAKQRKEAMK